jgi:hypothetical protein
VSEALLSSYLESRSPGVTPSKKTEEGFQEMASLMDGWTRLKGIHCDVTESILSYTCNQGGQAGIVKFYRFIQPCGVTAAECQDAAATGMLRIGTVEYAVEMNTAYVEPYGREQNCPQACRQQ